MSSEARPISPTQFALALEDLPLENLYAKAHEINNSIAHLLQSNSVLQEYSDSIKGDVSIDAGVRADGDQDYIDAIRENEIVIERQRGRVRLIKAEVERRGQIWHEAVPEGDGEGGVGNGVGEGEGDGQRSIRNGNGNGSSSGGQAETQVSGRLTDEELRRQVSSLYPQDGADDEGGMHL